MKYKTVNIESGMPLVEIGQKRLYLEIVTAKRQGIQTLKVIHGYGSSGTGGKLKKGILEFLAVKKKEGFIKDFVPGENWDIFSHATRDVLDHYKELKDDRDLGNCNPGITIVII